MLTYDDKGGPGGGVGKPPKHAYAYVIHILHRYAKHTWFCLSMLQSFDL